MMHTEAHPPRTGSISSAISSVEAWLETQSRVNVLVVLTCGLLIRLWVASGTFLNPDEALHFMLANQASAKLAYRASLTSLHPPLLIFLLHWLRLAGTSELFLRFPSIVAGTAFCWIYYLWLTKLLGRTIGWIGFLLATFLPSTILLSAEVRQYALLLLFICASAHLFEVAAERRSGKLMVLSFVCLYLGMLTHYSAFLFAMSFGVYALWRLFSERQEKAVLATWIAGQLVACGIATFLYVSHLSKVAGRNHSVPATQVWAGDAYLQRSYFQPGHDNPVLFVLARTGGVFQFVFAQLAVGDLAYVLFIIGLVFLFRRKVVPAKATITSSQLAVLLVLPFVLAAAASLVRAYPYGGSRHSSFLLMFALAGVSVCLAKLANNRATFALPITVVLLIVCAVFAQPRQQIPRSEQRIIHMQQAMQFIHEKIPRSDLILIDNQAFQLMGHYLCKQEIVHLEAGSHGFAAFVCDDYQNVVDLNSWAFSPADFLRDLQRLQGDGVVKARDTIWVIQAGWKVELASQLQETVPEFRSLQPHSFGHNIQIFAVRTGEPPTIASTN